MKKSILATALLLASLSANADLYVGADYSEDCAQPDISIANVKGYYNDENIEKGLIHPAIYVTRNPDENRAFSIDEITVLVHNYWKNVVTKQDYEYAINCGGLRVEDLSLLRIPAKD